MSQKGKDILARVQQEYRSAVSNPGPKTAVLAIGGAFNPPHCSHLLTAILSACALSDRFTFSHIIFAPAPDGYVRKKTPRFALPGTARLALLRLMARHFQAEAPCALFIPPRTSGSALEAAHRVATEDQQVVVVVGSDHARSRWQKKGKRNMWTVIVGREGTGAEAKERFESDRANGKVDDERFLFLDVSAGDGSSTLLRRLLVTSSDPVSAWIEEGLLPPKVAPEVLSVIRQHAEALPLLADTDRQVESGEGGEEEGEVKEEGFGTATSKPSRAPLPESESDPPDPVPYVEKGRGSPMQPPIVQMQEGDPGGGGTPQSSHAREL
uniref:Cytidyltransferase-like domain-containing protein n=1 Tax=Chromera velia CCMP2878 TaxID=1169474 RepID=A0A0G4HXL0_9ALVE|mmetsp:Transcript_49803/g.98163  ORF Transcript_49803/g.98163 Transcript_49803/m.98163 type:complete len:325 (+) Transcript_49803:25-999(+)|eukprot:Cvel_33141.t1-p1 / transcript=Cvel_33141.t1 / gene=Cvel_33141 / organism=Chromera_velia_CCMP2878 / gene_product=hypothetical protein / transcript_product=hypothetical protein / location=Cvel_scaffold5311:1694-2665(-) / protein_length=324 / sequence_SO=supercontig / SO=protein_coding / is_pseudo=false